MHIVQLSVLLAAAGVSHSMCAVSCKPLISTCLFNGTAAMQSYPLPIALPLVHVGAQTRTHARTQQTHMHARTPPPLPHPTLPYSHTPSQAKHIKCASVVAAGLMNNAQKQKTRPSFYYLILCGGVERDRESTERQGGSEGKA